jgi:hypothetical protein
MNWRTTMTTTTKVKVKKTSTKPTDYIGADFKMIGDAIYTVDGKWRYVPAKGWIPARPT